jgi:hypothetical protein
MVPGKGLKSHTYICDCEAVAYLRFRHLGHYFMELDGYQNAPIIKILHFIRSAGLLKGWNRRGCRIYQGGHGTRTAQGLPHIRLFSSEMPSASSRQKLLKRVSRNVVTTIDTWVQNNGKLLWLFREQPCMFYVQWDIKYFLFYHDAVWNGSFCITYHVVKNYVSLCTSLNIHHIEEQLRSVLCTLSRFFFRNC